MSASQSRDRNENDKGHRDALTFYLYVAINAVCAVVLLLLLIEIFSPRRIPVADVGAPLGLVLLFFLVPATWFFIWRRTRKLPLEIKRATLPRYTSARIFWTTTWLLSCAPILFYGSFYIHHFPRPWLESNQGPDTDQSHSAFTQYFDTKTDLDVQRVYSRTSPDMKLFRFDFSDATAVDRIVTAWKLSPVSKCYLNIVEPPKWWEERDREGKTQCFSDTKDGRQGKSQLWVNYDRRQVHFMDFTP
jgi:hypothetical protein